MTTREAAIFTLVIFIGITAIMTVAGALAVEVAHDIADAIPGNNLICEVDSSC